MVNSACGCEMELKRCEKRPKVMSKLPYMDVEVPVACGDLVLLGDLLDGGGGRQPGKVCNLGEVPLGRQKRKRRKK